MSENKTSHSKQYLLSALIVFLVALVGYQTWYMMGMKQQLDGISSNKSGTVNNTSIVQTPAIPDKVPPVAQQQDKHAQVPNSQQNPNAQGNPALSFNDDFFNQPFTSRNWDPYQEIERMQHDMDRMFNNAYSHFNGTPDFQSLFQDRTSLPQMDLKEDKSKYTVIMDMPGADEKNISVNLDGQQLTVSGEQDFDQKKQDANGNVIFQERHSGRFQRSITLPEPVKQSSLATHVDNGVLTITVTKMG